MSDITFQLRRQDDAGGDGACSVVAVFYADLVLQTCARPTQRAMDIMLDAGCAAWRLACVHATDSYLTPHEVVKRILTKDGAPRWRVWRELYGMHVAGTLPDTVLSAIAGAATTAAANTDGNTHYVATGLRGALRDINLQLRARPVVAAIFTTGVPAHSILLAARVCEDQTAEYYYADSLAGHMAVLGAPSAFAQYVDVAVPPLQWTDEVTASLAADGAAAANMPGQFYLSYIELAQ